MKESILVDGPESFLIALDKVAKEECLLPRFRGWPIFHVVIEGERYHGTMTPRLMEGFVEFHDQILRAYADVRYGSPSKGRLTNLEKAELDLVFSISKGCTDGKGPLDEILNKLFSVLPMNKLSGAQTALIVTVIVLSIAGYMTFKEWTALVTRTHQIEADSADKSQQARLAEVLAKALANKDLPDEGIRVRSHAVEGYRAIAKGAPDASGMEIQGEHYDAQDLQMVRDNEAPDRIREPRIDVLYIEMIKRTKASLSLTLKMVDSEYTFPGKVDLSTFAPQDIKVLFDSMRDSKPIKIQQFAVVEAGEIVSASVLAVIHPFP